KKKKGSEDLSDGKDDEKKNEKTAIDTEYIVQGDGQFTIQVMSVKDRDKALAKRAKEAKEQVKMEHKLELEDQGNKKDSKASQNKKDKSVNNPSKEKPSKDKPAGDAPSNEKPSNDKPSNDQVE
ncbi:MAG: SpoIVB peptidase S55, partial [Veillonella sp.]|nr:SpoIVB peptidase S55 [Veillonella sp.]